MNVTIPDLMLNKFVRLISLIFFLALFATSLLWGNSSNPPNGYHSESLNCASCHSGNLNTGDGSINLSGLPLNYTPGQTYDLALTVSGTNSRGFGFQLFPSVNGTSGGTLTAVSSDMEIENGAAEHRGKSSSGIWNFQWTAPATDEGTVSFYASGVATGGSTGNGGDFVYTMSQDISAVSFSHPSEEWSAITGGVIFSSAAIGHDGSIYIGSNDNNLHAFNADGTTKWTFSTGNWVDSTPAIGPDGTIYVGSWDNKVYAIDPENGTKLWEYETNSYIVASPSIGADGRIYIGSKDSLFYAFESNGSIAWEYFVGQPISSSAALGQDGTIYFGDENGTFHALNPDGSPKWTYEVEAVTDTNKSILSSPALDLSGNIYFGSGNGNCYSITDNGQSASLNWSFPTSDRVDASPVLGINDEVFFVSRDGYLRSLSTLTGNLNWDAFVGDVFYSSPVVDENGRTYIIGYTGGGENHLFAFDSDGTKAWDTNDTASPFAIGGIVDSSLTLGSDGRLYYGCYDNRIYCIDVGVPPASSDWPMFQRSAKHDGAWPSFLLETFVSPLGVASINGGGIYNEGATATIILSSISEGYSFSHWTGAASGSDLPLNIPINSSTSVTANFSLNQYSLSVNAGNGGDVTGNGTFNHGTLANITATPQTGYYFSGWSGDDITDINSASTTVSMTENRTALASFTRLNYTVSATVSPEDVGQINGAGSYEFETNATLAASATLPGYSFVSWSGDINSSVNPITFSVEDNFSVVANFSPDTYTLSVLSAGLGSTTGGGTYGYGDLVNISASPETGYSFTGWSGNGITENNAQSTTVSITDNTSVTAIFEPNSYNLSLSAGSGGTVSGFGTYTFGSVVVIEATPNEGYSFTSWFGGSVENENSAQTSLVISQNTSLSALFEVNEYILSAGTPTGGTISGAGQYPFGTTVTVNAIPENNYVFSHWIGENLNDINASSTSILINQNQQISAVFVEKPPEQKSVFLSSSPSNAGSTTGSGSYPEGELIQISATPLYGYEFSHWDGQNISDVNSSATTVLVENDQNITAHFQALSYQVNISSSLGGSVEGTGTYTHGSTISISANPENGYQFETWSGADLPNPLLESFSLEITKDLNLTATFVLKEYTLTLSQNIQGGTVWGGGVYSHGSTASLSATPMNGYRFINWTQDGSILETTNSISLVIESDYAITANFEKLVLTEFAGMKALGDEWYGSDWLGYFFATSTYWIYHLDLGWLYMIPHDEGSIWAWSPKLNWLWLTPSAFSESLAWSRNDNNWIYFYFEDQGGSQTYHYRNEKWNNF